MNNSILILVLVLVGVALVVVGVVLGVSSQRPEGPKVVDEINNHKLKFSLSCFHIPQILYWRRRYYSEPSITERLIAETNNLL